MQGGEKSSVRYEIGLLALLISFVYALSDFRPLGFSVSTLAAALISYLMARKANPMSTALFALLSILAAEPALSPALAVSAALAALLFTKSRLYAVSAGAISFAGLTFFTGGLPLFAGSFPEYMTGVLLSLSIPTGSVEKLLPFLAPPGGAKRWKMKFFLIKKRKTGIRFPTFPRRLKRFPKLFSSFRIQIPASAFSICGSFATACATGTAAPAPRANCAGKGTMP